MELSTKNIKKILLIVTLSAAVVWMFVRHELVLGALSWIFSVCSPFIIGFCLFFVLNVLLKSVEGMWEKIFKKAKSGIPGKIKRPVCIIISFLIVALIIGVLVFLILPEIRKTAEQISRMLPVYTEKIEGWWNGIVRTLNLSYAALPELDIDWEKAAAAATSFLSVGGKNFFSKTVGITSSIVGGAVNAVLGFVISVYILFSKEKLGRQIKKLTYAFLPEKTADYLTEVAAVSGRIFSKFVTGQLTEACIIAVVCFAGMNIFGMPYATMISTIVGITALIPIFGAFIGTAIGAFFIFMVSPVKAFWFIVFIIVLQQLEGDIIYPKVVGKSVGLSGIWVLAAVTIGAEISGVMGMLIAVPVCSVIYTLLSREVNKRKHRFPEDLRE